MRSWLIAPADNDKALAAVAGAGADVIVLDLARAIGQTAHQAAREAAREWIGAQRQQVLASRRFGRWVRIAALDTPNWREDLEAVIASQPDGIVLSDCRDPDQVKQLAAALYELEQREGIAQGQTQIVPQLGGSARGALAIPRFGEELHQRVVGLAWDASSLARSLGARRTRDARGAWSDTMAQVRVQVLLAAHAQDIAAIESPWRSARDAEATGHAARAARADGFTAMMAIHPGQIAPIAEAFAPTGEERAEAEAIIAGFASNPGQDSLAINGRRVGHVQLAQARRVLEVG